MPIGSRAAGQVSSRRSDTKPSAPMSLTPADRLTSSASPIRIRPAAPTSKPSLPTPVIRRTAAHGGLGGGLGLVFDW